MTGKVHIVDDDQPVRDALGMLLESAGLDWQAYESASDFLDSGEFQDDGPACILLDVNMPDMTGLECQRALRERGINIPVIILTGHANVPGAVNAMKHGAVDYLEKPLSDANLLINRVTESLERDAMRLRRKRAHEQAASALRKLTSREREIVSLVESGRANKVIAAELGISERTVEVHRSRAFGKLGIRHVADLVHLMELARTSRYPGSD